MGAHLVLLWAAALPSATASPQWADALELRPRVVRRLQVVGAEAPEDAIWLEAGKRVRLRVSGSAELKLSLWGIKKKKRGRFRSAGGILARTKGQGRSALHLSGDRLDVRIKGHPHWQLLARQELSVTLTGRQSSVIIFPNKRAIAGVLLRIDVVRPDDAVSAAPEIADEPLEAEPLEPEAQDSEANVAPTVAAAESSDEVEPEDDAEPEIPLFTPPEIEVANAPPQNEEEIVQLSAASPIAVEGPDGTQTAQRATVDAPLVVQATGPASLVLSARAVLPSDQESKDVDSAADALVVGILIDDVLGQTALLKRAPSLDYSATAAGGALGQAAQIRISVPAGTHQITVSPSDEGALGALISYKLETGAEEPVVIAERQDLIARSPLEQAGIPTSGASVLGGAWLTSALPSVGWILQLEAQWAATDSIAAGIIAAIAQASTSQTAADARVAEGRRTVTTRLRSIPVLLDARARVAVSSTTSLQLGVGGGVTLATGETTSDISSTSSERAIAMTAIVHATAHFHTDIGEWLLRAQYTASPAASVAGLRNFNPGGIALSVGFEFGI